ncbi:MAG: hypothetical protein L3J24_08325 [Xanthomonadales bacterium]|nr:hypothetical protein [Xanthomonadales bacterium]
MHFKKNILLIIMFALFVGLSSGASIAGTITVSSNSGGTGGTCTIRDAITAANTDANSGGCSAGNGADVIVLPAAATITLTGEDNATDGSNGLPSISSTITITGNNSIIERDADLSCNLDDINDVSEFRIFHVAATGILTIRNATLRNGCAEGSQPADQGGAIYNAGIFEISAGTVSNSSVTNDGGGIFSDGGFVTISNGSMISDNVAVDDDGGGIHIAPGGNLLVSNSFIVGNHAEGNANGGGIHCRSNTNVLIYNSLISNNWTEGNSSNGGAINCFGNLSIANSTFSNNRTLGASSNGGAIAQSGSGVLTVANSTFSGNYTLAANGGAIRLSSDAASTILNTTISGNSAASNGAGIYFSDDVGSVEITHSTITGNSVSGVDSDGGGIYIFQGAVLLNSSIVADNSDLAGASDIEINPGFGGSLSGSYNIIGDAITAGGLINAVDNNIVGVAVADVIDLNLQHNGGPTQTHALIEASLAVDQIPLATNGCGTLITTDQRGLGRPDDIACDIGAFEAFLTYDCDLQPWLVSDENDLLDAILCYNTRVLAGSYEISITQNINPSITSPSINNNNSNITLLFDGQGFAINAAFGLRPLEIITGTTVTLENVSFDNAVP